MAEFKISSLRYTYIGVWANGTDYVKDDVVSYAGKLYTSLVPHTSDTVYNDLAAGNLELTLDGKSYKGAWAQSTDYDLNDIVTLYPLSLAVYVCTTPHTSTTAFSLDSANWTLLFDFTRFENAWTPDTDYIVGSIVKYGGNAYIANTDHTSAPALYDLTIANLNSNGVTATISFSPDYNGVVTGVGSSIVLTGVNPGTYDGTYTITNVTNNTIDFLCAVSDAYVSGGTGTVPNDYDWGGLEIDNANWDLYYSSVEYTGNYQDSYRYKVGDLAKDGPSIYKCIVAHTSSNIPVLDLSKFTMYAEGEEFANEWNSAVQYNTGDIVKYGGYDYVSLQFNNTANQPSTSPLFWELFNTGYEFLSTWSNSTNYKVGDVVTRAGNVYIAIADNSNSNPTGFFQTQLYTALGSSGKTVKLDDTTSLSVGMVITGAGFSRGQVVKSITNSTTVILNEAPDGVLVDGQNINFSGHDPQYWNLVSTSFTWQNLWVPNINYVLNDLVVYGNGTYRCVRNNFNESPQDDINHDYWVYYVRHSLTNVLKDQGDIKTVDETGIVALSIPTENGLNLRSNGTTATWYKTFTSPNLFYVSADNGVDDSGSGYGETWDKPFRTIAYAANYVKNGVLNAGAVQRIRANKAFMIEEVIQYMYYQMSQSNAPFSPASVWNETKSRRDLSLIIDAIVYDLARGGNSQIVAATLSFFKLGSETEWFNTSVDATSDYIVDSLTYLYEGLLSPVLSGTAPALNYQALMSVPSSINQNYIGTVDEQSRTDALELLFLLVDALTNQNNSNLPAPNQGATATIYVKTGTYREVLPITVPANCCICGDELRGVTVEPLNVVNTIVTRSYSLDNTFEAYTTADMYVGCPIVFVTSNAFGATSVVIQRFESAAIDVGTTYYVKEVVSSTKFTVSSTLNGPVLSLAGEIGTMLVYGSAALGDMFYLRNGTGLRNMTFTGLLGTLGPINANLTQRPTGGAYASLDPGTGTDDSETWIIRRSPYIQNCTAFGIGCTGLKIDGTLHDGGNKSMVCNDYTHLLSDGIGIWCTGSGSLCEAVSVFSYYGYAGYMSEDGGRIRGTNGNSSYGSYGVIAEGYDITETPITGSVYNRQYDTQANIGFADDVTAGILNYTFTNAGAAHYNLTTNLLTYSNNYSGASWTNDGNVLLSQGTVGPDGLSNAWLLTGSTSSSNTAYLTQNITIVPSSGFNSPNQPYTFSVYLKQGTSAYVDLHAIFSGVSTRSSGIRFTWSTLAVTAVDPAGDGGLTVSSYGVQTLPNSWYRVWFVVYDTVATNTTLQYKLYPRGKDGSSGNVYVYGSQIENGNALRSYLNNTGTTRYSANANFVVIGNGSNALTVANETRSQSIFETRITDPDDGYGVGGQNYLNSSNSAQTGTAYTVTLAAADTNLATNYVGMALYLIAGTGVGQYGYISNYNSTSKVASIVKQSFEQVQITASAATGNLLSLDASADFNSLYLNQPVQFVPYYYNTTATATSQDYIAVTASTGGQTNTFTVASTARLSVGVPITFSGTVFGGVINNYTYYITEIVDGSTIKISTKLYGSTLFLNTDTGSMTLNYGSNTNYITAASTIGMTPNLKVQFSGATMGGISGSTIYYINDVIDSTTFAISPTLVTVTATNTTVTTNVITAADTTGLISCNPIVFAGTSFGNIVAGTKYYVSNVTSNVAFKISSSLITGSVTATTTSVNTFTIADSSSLIVGNPIVFYGNIFGGVVAETVYYVLTKPTSTTFTVTAVQGSLTPVSLNTLSGYMFVRSTGAAFTLSTDTGSLVGTSTSTRKTLTPATGSMSIVYQTSLFGGVVQGTTYYVLAKTAGSPNKITLTATDGGVAAVTLTTNTGAMSLVASGWDNVIPGKANADPLDTSTYYFIEPRLTYSVPPFTQTAKTLPTQATAYTAIAYGDGYWIAIGTNSTVTARSDDGTTWSNLASLTSAPYTGIGYGNKYWVALRSGSATCYYSNDNGSSWLTGTLPSSATWTHIAFGNNTFVAVDNTNSSAKAAYSTTYGKTWTAATLSLTPATGWNSLAYGAGVFVAIPNGSTATASYSTDYGATWATATLPRTTTWSSVAYGNGRFVAVSSTSGKAAYSFDGITWYASLYDVAANKITYGQGVFVALANASTTGYTTEEGQNWKTRTITSATYVGMAFGYDSSHVGKWITAAGTTTGSSIQAGARARVRGNVATGQLTDTIMLEPGSNYTSTPTLTIFDPNSTIPAVPQIRIADGALANPTFINRGTEYATNTTTLAVLSDGYADQYQTDLYINLGSLTLLPHEGDDLSITGDSTIYKITSVETLNGSTAPNITARVGISPAMSYLLSPAHGTSIIVRQKYSQVRLTNHDFLNVGYGDSVDSNYPGVPTVTNLAPQNQAIENNYGRVFYTSTDQDGNFKVGSLFGVEQATGIVTISASQFGLTGLSALSLGGISVGNISVVVNQFSTDPTFVANSDNIIPTQKAVKSYIESRLSQGGANTFTGNTVAGTVSIGGANIITSTLAPGVTGSTIRIPTTIKIGAAGIDGNMVAQAFFSSTWNKNRRVF